MSCNCKFYQRKLEKLQKKYVTLKKNHKKLLGVTVLLTDALEEFVKGGGKTEISDTLSTCSAIYPDLFNIEKYENEETNNLEILPDSNSMDELSNDKGLDAATESEKEYYEGFMARPKIPRTPQV